jgi:hypothetical protein
MYYDFVRLVEKNDKAKLKDYYLALKEFYESSSAHQL